jgi:hypothetical protein
VSTPVTTPATTSTAPAVPTVPADVPTTGPNAEPGEKPPVMPVLATEHTPAGAKAFAVFFIKTIDWAYATTSTTYMRHYFQPSCVACRSAADAVDKAAREHHHFIGDRFTIRRILLGEPRDEELSAIVHFDVTSAEVLDRHGNYVDAEPALTNFQEHVYEAWRSAGWTVTEMIPKA